MSHHENAIRAKLSQAQKARREGDPLAGAYVAMAAQVLEDLEQTRGSIEARRTLQRIKGDRT